VYKYSVAIDVGTSGTAFAYAARPAGGVVSLAGVNPSLIDAYAPGRLLTENSGKAPTAVLLGAEAPHELQGIGADAITDFLDARSENRGKEVLLFSEFKMLLEKSAKTAPDDRGDADSFVTFPTGGKKDERGRRAPHKLLQVVSGLLDGVKKIVLKRLKDGDSTLLDREVSWALTVPAIWDEVRQTVAASAPVVEDGCSVHRCTT